MTTPLPQTLVDRLVATRSRHAIPSHLRQGAERFTRQVLGTLFPHFADNADCSAHGVEEDLWRCAEQLGRLERAASTVLKASGPTVVPHFLSRLEGVHAVLEEDATAIFQGDPAARSLDEVLLTYPGFFAIAAYRVAHLLFDLKVPLLPRLVTEYAHERTGIDIHPGATIGRRFCIDHGTGVVIGETTHIGNGVKLYQGVTLGALTVEKALADKKRHPTIEDEVVIYAGATILGGATVVGHHSVVAGNAWLTTSVPPHSVVSRKSEVRPKGSSLDALDFVI